MSKTTTRLQTFPLALVAGATLALGACSRSGEDVAPPPAPSQMAAAPLPAPAPAPATATTPAPAPVAATPAPVVVAQNKNAYEQGRRDQQRRDARNERTLQEPPPRADRDQDVGPQRGHHDQRVAAAVCRECGVVESVTPVKVQGQTNGVGAVAGGLGGALVGNRIAGGHNRTLGGVVGAVGGGLLGNAIEKHERTSTVYDVKLHMEDGSWRTVRESSAPAVGEKVRVDADGLHDRS